MNKDIYEFRNLIEDSLYHFVSEGIRGKIEKVVLISLLPDSQDNYFKPLYNLAFGDLIIFDDDWWLDDTVRSGNGDMPKVIATVASVAMDFLAKYPDRALSFQGFIDQKSAAQGKNHRNTLYQRGINSNWLTLSAHFNFWGMAGGKVEAYVVGKQYDQILVKHK